ncbi:hypothetical protein MKW92_001319 [Papaver armeniacum]|nr:hypothetical protein MKW92_001319 [Papaver armeniacum]
MAEEIEKQTMNKPSLLINIMSNGRTWDFLSFLFCGLLLCSSWNFVQKILFRLDSATLAKCAESPALYASVVLGVVSMGIFALGVASMVAALVVAVPTIVVAWISVLVLLTFRGKSRKALVLGRTEITADIIGLAIRIYFDKVVLWLMFVFLLGMCGLV